MRADVARVLACGPEEPWQPRTPRAPVFLRARPSFVYPGVKPLRPDQHQDVPFEDTASTVRRTSRELSPQPRGTRRVTLPEPARIARKRLGNNVRASGAFPQKTAALLRGTVALAHLLNPHVVVVVVFGVNVIRIDSKRGSR
ncbi:hypothetical protein HPB50_016549 [Hyalomma asiaticum]|uniref:Uncharacterized protein n=1 Tax=Hyalomma asiaticum TaxID=266040 RepID=A0ACB7SX65_HYAAI|nr:hypothetical protein HPB50_016549 [Hyalomma asiaticum]